MLLFTTVAHHTYWHIALSTANESHTFRYHFQASLLYPVVIQPHQEVATMTSCQDWAKSRVR